MVKDVIIELKDKVYLDELLCYPDIEVILYMDRMLTEKEEEYISSVINSWYTVGLFGGYGFYEKDIEKFGYIRRLHNMRFVFDDEQCIYLNIDCGDNDIDVINVLIRILNEALNQMKVELEKVEIT